MNATFTVPIQPIGWSVRTAKGRQYAPTPLRRFKRQIALVASVSLRQARFAGPVRLDIVAVFDRPKYMRKVYRDGRAKHPRGLIPHTVKPDRDNVAKAIQDALSGCWGDDCQVTCGTTAKFYAEIDGAPRVMVRISDNVPSADAWLRFAGFE